MLSFDEIIVLQISHSKRSLEGLDQSNYFIHIDYFSRRNQFIRRMLTIQIAKKLIHNRLQSIFKSKTFISDAMASQLNSVRLKLEQRRKRIEEEKRKMELVMARQREKVGQQAFLRAVIKGVNTNTTNKLTPITLSITQ